MKLLKTTVKKIIFSSSILSSFLLSSTASAQFITWEPVDVAVPLSTTSTVILGLLLLAFGVFVAPKIRAKQQQLFMITAITGGLLMASMGIIGNKVHAVTPLENLDIVTSSGTEHLARNKKTLVTNNFTGAIRIVEVNRADCRLGEDTTCRENDILNQGQSCTVRLICDEEEVRDR